MSKFGFTVDETTKVKHDPKNKLSEVERKRVEYWEEEENRHDILEAGQEDRTRGLEAAKVQAQEQMRKDAKQKADVMNKLDMSRRFAHSYKFELAKALGEILEMLDWIRGWRATVMVTDGSPIQIKHKGIEKSYYTKDGLLIVVTTPDGRVFHQGMLVTQEPMLDYAGLYTLALQVENTLDKEKGLLLSPEDGPDLNAIVDKHGNAIKSKQSGGGSDKQGELDSYVRPPVPAVS